MYKAQGRLGEAAAVLERAISSSPASSQRLWLALGIMHTSSGDFRRAVGVYTTAMRIFPGDRMLRTNRSGAPKPLEN